MSLGAGKPYRSINRIATIGKVLLCLRQENHRNINRIAKIRKVLLCLRQENHRSINRIAKIRKVLLCLRQENLSFKNRCLNFLFIGNVFGISVMVIHVTCSLILFIHNLPNNIRFCHLFCRRLMLSYCYLVLPFVL